jgi:hypothetical protein
MMDLLLGQVTREMQTGLLCLIILTLLPLFIWLIADLEDKKQNWLFRRRLRRSGSPPWRFRG